MLRYTYRMKPRKLPHSEGPCSGPQGRINRLRRLVTALFRYERVEGRLDPCDEARGYAERLIQLALRNGDKDPWTMEMADFWLLEKDLVHKLFKVLAPRYQNYTTSFTNIWRLPTEYPGPGYALAILELQGNCWPPIISNKRSTKEYLTNILLDEARKNYFELKNLDNSKQCKISNKDHSWKLDTNREVMDQMADSAPISVSPGVHLGEKDSKTDTAV